jgi:hypothetical protein
MKAPIEGSPPGGPSSTEREYAVLVVPTPIEVKI